MGNEILDDYGAFAQSEEKRVKLEECNELGRKWLRKRDVVRLGELKLHPHALNGMVVYWIEGGEGDDTSDKMGGERKIVQPDDGTKGTGIETRSDDVAETGVKLGPKRED